MECCFVDSILSVQKGGPVVSWSIVLQTEQPNMKLCHQTNMLLWYDY